MLTQAIVLATTMHEDQVDKCGEPYILHPLRVMMSVQGDVCRTVATLHDVIEDTTITIDEIRELKLFTDEVIDALEAITHPKEELYKDYISRVMKNSIAKIVKIADVKDNASPSRLYKLDHDTIIRLTKKYSAALKILDN